MKWLKKVAATPLTSIARVVDSLQNQTNDRTNAPSIRAVNEAINKNWLTVYPIGSIYMCVNNIDPSEIFGGTWVQIKDRFLLAAGDTYSNGETGGEATHTLTVDEMPSHNHAYDTYNTTIYSFGGSEISAYMNTRGTSKGTETRGGGQAHNNMPPYLAVKVWKRTA
jgi:hypothetical protein